jgi:hypothetical protein
MPDPAFPNAFLDLAPVKDGGIQVGDLPFRCPAKLDSAYLKVRSRFATGLTPEKGKSPNHAATAAF